MLLVIQLFLPRSSLYLFSRFFSEFFLLFLFFHLRFLLDFFFILLPQSRYILICFQLHPVMHVNLIQRYPLGDILLQQALNQISDLFGEQILVSFILPRWIRRLCFFYLPGYIIHSLPIEGHHPIHHRIKHDTHGPNINSWITGRISSTGNLPS